jgi:hypothetical protein
MEKKRPNRKGKGAKKSGSKDRAWYAYPSPEEAQALRRGQRITGESESRYLIEGGLLRAKVVADRRTREFSRAAEIDSNQV